MPDATIFFITTKWLIFLVLQCKRVANNQRYKSKDITGTSTAFIIFFESSTVAQVLSTVSWLSRD